jgi:hypothetical protein
VCGARLHPAVWAHRHCLWLGWVRRPMSEEGAPAGKRRRRAVSPSKLCIFEGIAGRYSGGRCKKNKGTGSDYCVHHARSTEEGHIDSPGAPRPSASIAPTPSAPAHPDPSTPASANAAALLELVSVVGSLSERHAAVSLELSRLGARVSRLEAVTPAIRSALEIESRLSMLNTLVRSGR